MMKVFLLVCLTILGFNAIAQEPAADTPLYLKFKQIPAFTITSLPDSTQFTKQNLKKKRNTLIMVFSPDCDHCKKATEDMLSHMAELKNTEIVMTTPLEYQFIPSFYAEYKLAQYPNIHVGRDPSYALGTFYGVRLYPTVAAYNRKGEFVQLFSGHFTFADVVKALK